MPAHYYLLGASTLAQLPRQDWRRLGVSILAQLPYVDAQSLFVRPWSLQDCASTVQRIRAAVPGAPLYLGLMAADERGVQDRRLATFSNYSLTGPFLPNVVRLALAAKAAGCIGCACDCEIYPWSRHPRTGELHSGGEMAPGVAWPDAPAVQAHARAFRAALGGLPLLCYVWLSDLLRTRSGVSLFPGWKPWVKAVRPAAILEEGGYVGKPYKPATWEAVPVIPGLYLDRKVARNLSRRRKAAFLWSDQPPSAVW